MHEGDIYLNKTAWLMSFGWLVSIPLILIFIFHPLETFSKWCRPEGALTSLGQSERGFWLLRDFILKTCLRVHFVDFKPGSRKISDRTTCFATWEEINSFAFIDFKIRFWLTVVTWLENTFGNILCRLNVKRRQSLSGFLKYYEHRDLFRRDSSPLS